MARSAALALGAVLKIGTHTYMPLAQTWHGVRLSGVMPFTWFVQLPGMAGFREAARLTMLGVLPAALLAGAAVDWLRRARRAADPGAHPRRPGGRLGGQPRR